MNSPFDSPALWIASLDSTVAKTIGTFLEPFLDQQIPHCFNASHILGLNNGEELHRALDEQSKQVLFNSVCVIDLTASGTDFQFDLRADARHVLRPTELIVRYPEIYWIFVVNRLPDWESAEDQLQRVCISPDLLLLHFVEVTRLMDLVLRLREHASGYRTIFDPTGLRFLVLISSNATHTKQDTISPLGLPSLNQLSQSGPLTYGISLEDELGYALLNGYFLYKQGLSTFVIATLAEYRRSVTYAQHLSNNHDTSLPFAWHAIEDVELCFADTLDVEPFRNLLMPAEGENDFEMLAARAANNPLLKLAKTRLILTTVRLERNQLKQTSGQNCETLSKPYRGLYDDTLNLLFSETSTPAGDRAFGRLHFRVLMTFQCFFFLLVAKQRLGRLLKSTQSKCSSLIRRFLHFGPLNSKQDDLPPKVHVPEHSAPGSNQEVAAHLLKRCKSSSHTLTAPEDAIQCSVMANVAYRLLNKRTQHTALDALSLQNLMEAEAECMFIGISNSLDITPRVTSIEREVALVTSVNAADDYAKFWKRHQQRCSALLKIFGDLRHVYQHYDQREQESDLLCAFRSWQRLAFINGNKEWINNCFTTRWLKGLGRCALSVLWGYLNFLVGSGRNLLFASALWIVLFAGAYDVLVTATIAEHRRLQEWQSIHLKAAKIQRSRPTLQIEDVIGDLRFDYFSYWLPQSAATFVGMHQFLEGGLHPALISDFVSLNADEDRRRITEHIETPFSPHITHIRILLKTWWFLVVCEMALGYTHLAAAVTLMLARFSRK